MIVKSSLCIKRNILVAVLLVAILGGLAWVALQPGEPVYEGRPLSDSLEGHDPQGQFNNQKREKADEAIRHVGTNAIPTLLRMLRAKDTPLKLKLIELLGKQHLIKIKYTPAGSLNFAAARGFYLLGTNASAAVPALIEIYQRNISYMSQYRTAISLAAIGPPAKSAIPTLVKGMTNSDLSMRHSLITALGQIHSEPELVVPALIGTLGDSNWIIRQSATQVLGSFEADARPSVPALIKLLKDPEAVVRSEASNALKQIDSEAATRAGINLR